MGSSLAKGAVPALGAPGDSPLASLAGNPWLWSALAAFFFGLASALAIRWLASLLKHDGRSARLSALAILALALSVLAAAAFLVFSGISSLPLGPGRTFILVYWLVAMALFGAMFGAFPRVGGLVFLCASLLAAFFFSDALSGWLPLRGPGRIARLLPFSVSAASFRGEFTIQERDTVPTLQRVELPVSAAALVVERAELAGPATILGGPSLYRIIGIAGPDGRLVTSFAGHRSLLDWLSPLSEAKPERGGLIRRSRAWSAAAPLADLEPVVYSFDAPAAAKPGLAEMPGQEEGGNALASSLVLFASGVAPGGVAPGGAASMTSP